MCSAVHWVVLDEQRKAYQPTLVGVFLTKRIFTPSLRVTEKPLGTHTVYLCPAQVKSPKAEVKGLPRYFFLGTTFFLNTSLFC